MLRAIDVLVILVVESVGDKHASPLSSTEHHADRHCLVDSYRSYRHANKTAVVVRKVEESGEVDGRRVVVLDCWLLSLREPIVGWCLQSGPVSQEGYPVLLTTYLVAKSKRELVSRREMQSIKIAFRAS